MEPFVNFVIRPPRAEYSVGDLLEAEFSIKGRPYKRKDLEITNSKGQVLQCSHYVPAELPEDTKLPCVIYCHGNSGCRADGNGAAFVLLPSNITVFTLDFSGSGLSDGDFVSLGWNEKEDLKAVVTYVRSLKQTSCIGLWGRSMGAVTSLLYGAEDPSIAGMVLDSPFSNLFTLMMELVDVYKIRLPKFTIRVALQIMRRIIQKRVQFDIMDMNIVQHASKTFIPALFGHATGDAFIPPHHSDLIHRVYAGDKNIIKFEGDHNSSRPQFYYDSVTIFFHNVLSPPTHPSLEDTCNFLAYGVNAFPSFQGLIEHSEPVRSMQNSENSEGHMKLLQQEAVSRLGDINGSFTPGKENVPQQEILSKLGEANVLQSRKSNLEHPTDIAGIIRRMKGNHDNPEFYTCDQLESSGREQSGDCSYPSSNGASTEGWVRCASPGKSEKSTDGPSGRQIFAEIPSNVDEEEKMILRAISVALQETNSMKVEEFLNADNGSVITPRRKCRFEAFSRRFGLGCFRGMGKRNKESM